MQATHPEYEQVHQTLRHATAQAHHQLDHHPLLQRLTSGHLTRGQYAESLAAMYRPHVRLEQLVHQSSHHVATGLGLSARFRLLEADLVELGRPIPEAPVYVPDRLEGRAEWWGRVFVLEGSRQGGAVIARRLRSSLGETIACRFFGDLPVPGKHDAVRAMRENELSGNDEFAQAVASARRAFADYRAGLDAFDRSEATCQ